MTAETSNARGEVEYEYEVWQGAVLQAGGRENDYASAQSEANHYAMMYAPDGPVEVRIYEKRLLSAAKVRPKRRPYNASGSLSEYGVSQSVMPPMPPSQESAMDKPIPETAVEAVARAICVACEENPDRQGDARGNEFRWQDYRDAALAALSAFTAAQQPTEDGCHCGTCTCNPNMTPAVRFDLSPAQMEGAIRDHLIRLGWTPPDEHAVSQPAAPSETVNVIGMPEFDSLLDHIYEYGTAAEGVIERANAFARAVIARYEPQQSAAVDEAAAIRAFEEHFEASAEDPYFEGELELWLTAWRKALATQQQEARNG